VQCGAVWCSVVQCGAVWCSVLQQRSKGITEFVPLPFVHDQALMHLRGKSRQVC